MDGPVCSSIHVRRDICVVSRFGGLLLAKLLQTFMGSPEGEHLPLFLLGEYLGQGLLGEPCPCDFILPSKVFCRVDARFSSPGSCMALGSLAGGLSTDNLFDLSLSSWLVAASH